MPVIYKVFTRPTKSRSEKNMSVTLDYFKAVYVFQTLHKYWRGIFSWKIRDLHTKT